jgi:hypothetical protein
MTCGRASFTPHATASLPDKNILLCIKNHSSRTIVIAFILHSFAQMPQPLQKP